VFANPNCHREFLSQCSSSKKGSKNRKTGLSSTTNDGSHDVNTAIFWIAPQLRDVCFLSNRRLYGNQPRKLDLPWNQLRTLTIGMPDLDYVWMIFSQALHMESCTFVDMINRGNPWHGIIRHTELKELAFKDVLDNYTDTFPALLSDVLVLPNLVSLLVDLEGEGDGFFTASLPIIPVVSLIVRSECRLTKLVLNTPFIVGSLITLLKETASLVHLEVHTLLRADIKSLTVDKTDGKQPVTPCLRVIHLTRIGDIADPSSMNDLIRSREVDAEVPHLEPIRNMQLHFVVPSRAHQVYGELRGLPWIPEYNGFEYSSAIRWAEALRTFTARPGPPKNEVSLSIILSNFVDPDHPEGYFIDKRRPLPNGAVESN